MTTGKDAGGDLLLPGEQIGRKDALRLYTAASAWFNFEEKELGSIETGKLADLVVLDKPFLYDPDEELKANEAAAHDGRRPRRVSRAVPFEEIAKLELANAFASDAAGHPALRMRSRIHQPICCSTDRLREIRVPAPTRTRRRKTAPGHSESCGRGRSRIGNSPRFRQR